MGGHSTLATATQTFIAASSLLALNTALSAAGCRPLYKRVSLLLLAVPYATSQAICRTARNRDSCANRIAYGIHDHLSHFFLTLTVGSCLTLLRNGKFLTGVSGIATLAIIPLWGTRSENQPDTPGWERAKTACLYFQHAVGWSCVIGDLISNSYMQRARGLLVGVAWIVGYFVLKPPAPPPKPAATPVDIVNSEYQTEDLSVARWYPYAYENVTPPDCKPADYNILSEWFEQTSWSDEETTNALHWHNSWNKHPQNCTAKAYIEQGLQRLVGQLKGDVSGLNKLPTFGRIQTQASHVIRHLETLPPAQRKAPLLRLAISGTICPLAPQTVIDELFQDLGLRPKTLVDQINHALAPLRLQLFQGIKPPERLADVFRQQIQVDNQPLTDEHFFNLIILAFGKGFGLREKARAETDPTIVAYSSALRIIWSLEGRTPDTVFWEQYDAKAVVAEASRAINGDWDKVKQKRVNQQVDSQVVLDWAQAKYIQATGGENGFSDWYAESMLTEKRAVKPPYIRLMLVDLGLLTPKC